MGEQMDKRLADGARDFLLLFSPDKPPRYAGGGEQVRNPMRLLRQALDEAQFVLNRTSSATIRSRSRVVARQRRLQKLVSIMHFVTASSFALLLAGKWPEIMKWVIPSISLGAGILGIALPGNSASAERQIFEDIDRVSELSGRIVQVQTQMRMGGEELDASLSTEALAILNQCTALARRYELDQEAAAAGSLPRPMPVAT